LWIDGDCLVFAMDVVWWEVDVAGSVVGGSRLRSAVQDIWEVF